MVQIKAVSCRSDQFLLQAEMTPSFVCWPCADNNQIITGRKALCLKFTFGAQAELQRALNVHVANHSALQKAGRRPWLISTKLGMTFTTLIRIFSVYMIQGH